MQPDHPNNSATTSNNVQHGVNGLQIRGVTNLRNQVPTCLVVTSNEAATSVEAQFNALSDELSMKVKSINIFIDEKKCETLKATIEHI